MINYSQSIKISQLDELANGSITPDDFIAIVDSGSLTTKRVSLLNLKAEVFGGGLGNVGGDTTGGTTNLTYTKRIGLDVYISTTNVYQFDLEFFAKYKSDNLNINVFPTANIKQSLGDLQQTISQLNPTITQTQSSGGCFVKGTKVMLDSNTLSNIEDIHEGSNILTFNELTGELEIGSVVKLIRPTNTEFISILLENGEVIQSTHDHPYYTENGWSAYNQTLANKIHDLEIGQLEAGQKVKSFNGEYINILAITELTLPEQTVYNFEIQGNHNYFVNNILVHNKRAFDIFETS